MAAAGAGGAAAVGRKEEAAGGGRRGKGAAAAVPKGGTAGARTSIAAGSPARRRGPRLRRGAHLAAAPSPVPAARFARPLHRLLLKPAAAPAPAAASQLPTTPATARRRPAPRCPCTARRGPATACCSLALTPHRARPRLPGGAARAGCPASGCRASPQRPRRRLTGRPPAGPCSARRRPSEGRREMREERKRETEKRERVGVALTSGPHLHVASTSAKPPDGQK